MVLEMHKPVVVIKKKKKKKGMESLFRFKKIIYCHTVFRLKIFPMNIPQV